MVVYLAGQGVTDVLLPDVFGLRKLLGIQHAGGVLKLGLSVLACKRSALIRSRTALLPLHVTPLYLLHQLNQHPCRGEWRRSPSSLSSPVISLTTSQVGQSLIIAISIALNDLAFMSSDLRRLDLPAITRLGLPSSNQELLDRHLFSFYFTLPLIGVCLALLRHNWYAHLFSLALLLTIAP